jgi:hypothetical protein
MEDQQLRYSLEFDINGLRAMKSSVQYLLDVWPGAPARPAQEQEFLWAVRDTLDRCILQHTFDSDPK